MNHGDYVLDTQGISHFVVLRVESEVREVVQCYQRDLRLNDTLYEKCKCIRHFNEQC